MSAFEKIIGYEDIKQELEGIADALRDDAAYKALGVRPPVGLLLHGKPGVGKTLMAKCLIEESGREAFSVKKTVANAAFVDQIKEIFDAAAEAAPSIVFLDDMDKFSNGDRHHRNTDEMVALQTCIDEVAGKGVFVLATANDTDVLPDSLLRPGRFDRKIEVDTPSVEDAPSIVGSYLAGKPLADDVDVVMLARMLHGYSCATLEAVVNEAGLSAARRRADLISFDDLVQACLSSVYKIPVDSAEFFADVDLNVPIEASKVIWHEAGHAAMSEIVRPGSVVFVAARVSERSGRPQGLAVDDIRNSQSLSNMKASIMVSLAGRAAMDVRFGEVDMGSGRDIATAFRRANTLQEDLCSEGFSLNSPFSDSDAIKHARELSHASLVADSYRRVKEALIANMPFMEEVARGLAKRGYLTGTEVSAIRERHTLAPIPL